MYNKIFLVTEFDQSTIILQKKKTYILSYFFLQITIKGILYKNF